jgi:tripartite-type tricarboxylate transporter receptor subunit TctC
MARHLISRGSAALFAVLLAAGTVAAAPYPTRTVEIVVPYGAGGSTDLTARMLAQKLQDRLGQSFVVINRPGASGSIGVMSVARAEPDGYTLLMSYATETVVVPQMAKPAKYTIDDFEPIAVTGEVPLVLVTSRSIAANTLGELIAAIRRAPGKYTYGGSVGSPSHLSGAWFNRLQHLDVQHIPYKGGAQAMGDFAEAGIADFELSSWTMMLAPKGTPAEIVQVLKLEVARALDNPQMRNLLNEQRIEPPPPMNVRDFLVRENEKFGRLVRETGIAMAP